MKDLKPEYYFNGYVYNEDIWHKPMKIPTALGANFTTIGLDQIPFDWRILEKDEIIKNEFGDRLVFKGDYYVFINNDPTKFLGKWFCKWEIF
jgi:hypothetical protein